MIALEGLALGRRLGAPVMPRASLPPGDFAGAEDHAAISGGNDGGDTRVGERGRSGSGWGEPRRREDRGGDDGVGTGGSGGGRSDGWTDQEESGAQGGRGRSTGGGGRGGTDPDGCGDRGRVGYGGNVGDAEGDRCDDDEK